jgi:hypothetical protein
MRFKQEIQNFKRNDISLDHEAIIDLLNEFLTYIESDFQLETGGYCNGFSALFSRYAAYGNCSEWLGEMMAVQNITRNDINKYETHQLLMKTILTLSQFQTGSKLRNSNQYQQLHIEKIDMISDIHFYKLSSIFKDNVNASKLFSYIIEQDLFNNTLRIQAFSDLENGMERMIDISMDPITKNYQAIIKPAQEVLIFDSLANLLFWTQKKAATLFSCEVTDSLIITLIDKNKFKVIMKDKAYVLLGNKAFDDIEILKNMEPDTVALLAIDKHTVSINKTKESDYILYNTQNDLPLICQEKQMAANLVKLEGHASLCIFQRADKIPSANAMLSTLMFEKLQELKVAKLYEQVRILDINTQNQQAFDESSIESSSSRETSTDERSIEELIYDNFELSHLALFCLKNGHEDVLMYHLQQISPAFLQNTSNLLLDIAEAGHYELLEFCIDKKLYLDTSDQDSMTPLHLACFYQHPTLVELLLIKGADTTIPNAEGKTVYETALLNQNKPILFLLMKHAEKNDIFDQLPAEFIDFVAQFINLSQELPSEFSDAAAQFAEENNYNYHIPGKQLNPAWMENKITFTQTKHIPEASFFRRKTTRNDREDSDEEISHKKRRSQENSNGM